MNTIKRAQPRGTSFIAAALIATTVCVAAHPQQQTGVFKVEPSGRYLLDPKGKPFFWLGDTAWLLCHRTRREDVELYLQTRAKQGFTVIEAAAVMAEERVGGVAFAQSSQTNPRAKRMGS